MADYLNRVLSNMDEQAVQEALENLDEGQARAAIIWAIDELIVPHLLEIRQKARSYPNSEMVRQHYDSMSEEEQEQLFYDELGNLVGTLVLCRERPVEGFRQLKTMLRDPYTIEALLLIWENEDHIDPGYTDQLKDFTAEHLRWVGALVLPEMYDEDEVEEVIERFNLEDRTDVDSGVQRRG